VAAVARRTKARGSVTAAAIRAERAVVGGLMRLVAVLAERRVRRSLDGRGHKRRRHDGIHVDLEDRL